MNLIEFNDKLLKKRGKTPVSIPALSKEEKEVFNDLIMCNKNVRNAFDATNSDVSFYGTYPDIKKIVGKERSVELFYAYKMNQDFPGVPNKAVFVLRLAARKYGVTNTNLIINSVLQYLAPYAEQSYEIDGETYTIKDVVENITGKNATLLTDSVRKVKTPDKDVYELWIPDVNRVAVVPSDIAALITDDDAYKLTYDKKVGIVLNGTPIRTFNNRLGITQFDFNLEECV